MNSNKVKIICHFKESVMDRESAIEHFIDAVSNSVGSEQTRYATVLQNLIRGKDICDDGYKLYS